MIRRAPAAAVDAMLIKLGDLGERIAALKADVRALPVTYSRI
jgi:hypothetical protein